MSVTLTGAHVSWINNADGQQPLTIPADADGLVLWVSGLANQSRLLAALNFDNGGTLDFEYIGGNAYGASQQVEAYIITADSPDWPGVGARTIHYSSAGAYTEGFVFDIQALKGAKQISPIGASDVGPNGNTDPATWTSDLGVVPSGAMSFVAAYGFSGDALLNAAAGAGQTELYYNTQYNGAQLAIGYEADESAMVITDAQPGAFPGMTAFAFYVSPETGAPTVTVYTVAADPVSGTDSILDGSGAGIGNEVEVPTQTDQGDAITWYTPFDGTFLIDNATGQKTFTARSRIDAGSAWTPAATFTVN